MFIIIIILLIFKQRWFHNLFTGGAQREEACCGTQIAGTCLEALFAYQAHCCNSEWELEIKI